jgi:hypothetical protein
MGTKRVAGATKAVGSETQSSLKKEVKDFVYKNPAMAGGALVVGAGGQFTVK